MGATSAGIGAANGCHAQVLVWQDMVGLRTGRLPRFVKRYADVHGELRDVRSGSPRRRWRRVRSRGLNTPSRGCEPARGALG
ncbi:3-methyl-2-oxobutanoate hydroxymethyltransferase [Streptomyces sp. NPDC012510]|uniref:3-methyl-2-oxobutanoate hydroxymethyltransferase n=1 Tax=Streptomyces sp. NPDC012510 TaxID=3364838 RepID=UPI0036EEF128